MKKQLEKSMQKINELPIMKNVKNNQKYPLQIVVASPEKNGNEKNTKNEKDKKPIDKNIEQSSTKNTISTNALPTVKSDDKKASNINQANKAPQLPKKTNLQLLNHQTNKTPISKQPLKQIQKLNKSVQKEKRTIQKDQSLTKLQTKDKILQNKNVPQSNKLNQSLDKSIHISPSKPKDNKQKALNANLNLNKSQVNKIPQSISSQSPQKDAKELNNPKIQISKLNNSKSKQQITLPISPVSKDIKGKLTNSKDQPKEVNKDRKLSIPQKKLSPQKKQQKKQNPSKSLIIETPSKKQDKNNKSQANKVNQSSAKLQTKQSPLKGNSKQSSSKDLKPIKNESLPKSPNKDSKNSVLKQVQTTVKKQLNKKEILPKGSGEKANINVKNSTDNQSNQKKTNNQSLTKDQKGKLSQKLSIPQRVIESAPQSPRVKQSKYSPEDIERLRFIKKLQKDRKSIEQRQYQQRQLKEMEQERIQQEKQREQQRQQSQQKANKLRSIEARVQEIERKKEQRKRQNSERNRDYFQKKTQFTLQHKIINQWLEKELQENKIKEKQLEAKISKMKPTNHLQVIKDHVQLIDSYRQMHNSRFKEEDLKFQRSKSRLELQKMYKSNWYKQIQSNDHLETYKLEQEKKNEEKELLLMKIDNMKKYAEYVKTNHKPENTEESVFKYEKPIINNFTAQKIRQIGMENLTYCKEHVEKNPKKNSKAALSEHSQPPKYKDYLQNLKTQRKKKENLGSQNDFDQLVENIKSSTSLTKEEKIKRITQLAQKMQKKAHQKEQLFNRTNTSRVKILQNKRKDSVVMKRESSLPFLKQRSASQPKLKINDSHKNLLRNKSKGNDNDFMKQINEKLMLLKNI